jgi:hypothetical protein
MDKINVREETTLKDLIQNPTGPHSRQVAARYTIRDALTAKFKAAMLDRNRKTRFKLYITKKLEQYIVWIKVPSEKYEVEYDVIFELTFPDGVRSITNANVRLFCNSPSWVFTSAYAYRQSNLLIKGWDKPLGKAATEEPKVTNPNMDTGYDKVVFQAILYLTQAHGLLTMHDLNSSLSHKVPNPNDPSMSASAKLFEYNKAKAIYTTKMRIEKEKDKKLKEKNDLEAKNSSKSSTKTKKIQAAKSIKAVNSVKKSQRRK